jgi:hypothetical protein
MNEMVLLLQTSIDLAPGFSPDKKKDPVPMPGETKSHRPFPNA